MHPQSVLDYSKAPLRIGNNLFILHQHNLPDIKIIKRIWWQNYLYIKVFYSLLRPNPNSQKLKHYVRRMLCGYTHKRCGNCVYVEKGWGVQNVQRPRPHTHALEIRRRICARSPDICKPRAATWTYHFHSKLSNITMKVPSLLTTTIHIAVIALIGLGGSPLSVQL